MGDLWLVSSFCAGLRCVKLRSNNQNTIMPTIAPFIVTIDGTTASGKSTVARAIAERFDLFHLRGGTFLRSFAYFILASKVDPTDSKQVVLQLDKFHLKIVTQPESSDYLICVNEIPVQNYLWTNEVDEIVSSTSRPAQVRAARVSWKQSFARGKRLVADGRTLGSEVFPWANVKIHLTTSLDQRAERRYLQNVQNGVATSALNDVRKQIENRDISDAIGELDRTRIYSDQRIVDSTNMSLSETVEQISALIESTKRTSL